MVEDNAAADDSNNINNINGEENDNNPVLAVQQQEVKVAHEIPTSDHDDQGSSSFENNSDYYGFDPHHLNNINNNSNNIHMPAGLVNNSFYSPPHHHHLSPPNNMLTAGPPMTLPPIPPPPDNNNEQQLDFTRQYYEARMREHAMQYANAAAGAAWAAARMADRFSLQHQQGGAGSYVTNAAGGGHFDGPLDHHGTNNMMMNNMMANNGGGGYPQQFHPEYHHQLQHHSQTQPQQQRRKLWQPPKDNVKSKKLKHPTADNNHHHHRSSNESSNNNDHNNTTTEGERIKHLSKKRESGNDSVSSLGSESYHHQQHTTTQQSQHHHSAASSTNTNNSGGRQQHNNQIKKKKKGKKNQRRRFNEDNDHEHEQPTLTTTTSAFNVTNNAAADYNGNDGNNSNSNQRQKRGLQHHHQQHGHSSKSSFSSMGGSGNNSNRKKKNRSILPPISNNNPNTTNNANTIQGIFLGGLIGKTGVSALHELCHKYRWEKPVYTLIENDVAAAANNDSGGVGGNDDDDEEAREGANDTTTNSVTSQNSNNRINNNQYQVHPHEFVLAVHVNKIELGRGRGDSKTAAKQDGSRKALAALVPGVVFDPNGILLDVGGGGGGGGGRGSSSGDGRLLPSSSSRSSGGVITSMEELGPHLASQLAIGGGTNTGNVQRSSRPSSPDHSETSSISTSVSMTKMTRVGSISSIIDNVGIGEGGGVISGGPVVGIIGGRHCLSNIYPCASTTSGVSSASEVEDGEDENAYYASRGASVCSTLLQAMWQIDDRIRQPPSYAFDVYPIPGAKESGGGVEQPNKRRKSGGPSLESKKPAHRGTFQCTATLNLYFRMDEEGKEYSPSSLMESWESPLEYLQSKDKTFSSSYYGNIVSSQESRKRKDSFASQATPSPDRRLKGDGNDEPENSVSKRQKVDEFVKHTLESKATGSTKRESKHKASAKLLTLLFPECSSLVEVKAAAEAARECYAATKAMSSQTKRAKLSDKGSPERKGPAAERTLAKSDSFVSVAGLSLSEEPVDESKRIKWRDSAKAETIVGFDANFECEVDTALKCLRDQEEEPSDDVGRIVLCRAQPDDAELIYALLNKASESNRCGEIASVHATSGEDVTASVYGSDSIFLLLSRAVSSHEPLGCAILTFVNSSMGGGRSLILQNIGHEEHLPRERFVECLEAFASKLETNLVTSRIFNDVRLISPDEIRKCLIQSKTSNRPSSPPSYQGEEVISMNMKGNSSHHSLLQSVKEEDSEDADDGSDGENINMEKEVDRAHDIEANANGKRPLRSKRRREIHDQQKH
eukprot:scaffold1334_cov114-Skeletonema_dohrnii-CCMP3373.AAC.1